MFKTANRASLEKQPAVSAATMVQAEFSSFTNSRDRLTKLDFIGVALAIRLFLAAAS